MNKNISRKEFLKFMSLGAGAIYLSGFRFDDRQKNKSKMHLGLVTYQWGKDWDIPTIIKNCTAAGIHGVELRVEHAHGVGIELNQAERLKVKNLFSESPVKVLGMGTNQQFDYPEQDELRKSIEISKEFIKLSHDIGGTGVKVKPNGFHENVPKEKTIEQIGKSLNEIGKFANDYGQQIRLEVHGRVTQELPNIKAIMDVADNPNITVCWNSNPEDLIGEGLEYNFNLVKNRLGDTVHVRELNSEEYPYQKLMNLFKSVNYNGWILLECRTNPEDKVAALIEQRKIWEDMLK